MLRLRLYFGKTPLMRYTAHLDTQRALERTIRRAKLPLAYSEGFTPHAKMNLAAALPLGFTSIGELADIWLVAKQNQFSDMLSEEIPVEDVLAAMQQSAPPGLVFYQGVVVPLKEASLQARVQSAEYSCCLHTPQADLTQRIADLLSSVSLPRERRGKAYNLRPLIEDVDEKSSCIECTLCAFQSVQDGRQHLWMRLKTREGASGRPDEVLDALGIPLYEAAIQRTRLIIAE